MIGRACTERCCEVFALKPDVRQNVFTLRPGVRSNNRLNLSPHIVRVNASPNKAGF